jgi:hypothetical protein
MCEKVRGVGFMLVPFWSVSADIVGLIEK